MTTYKQSYRLGNNPWSPAPHRYWDTTFPPYEPDSFWNSEDPGVQETVFKNFVGSAPSENMRSYFGKQFQDFFNKYQANLASMFDMGGDTTQETFFDYLRQQPFGSTFAGLSPEAAGRRTGQYNPFTRFLSQ